jgi:hypothetical protein
MLHGTTATTRNKLGIQSTLTHNDNDNEEYKEDGSDVMDLMENKTTSCPLVGCSLSANTMLMLHAYPGELSLRPGFCVMELHQLYFDFIAPFWEEARLNPSKQLKRTYKYLESKVDESD